MNRKHQRHNTESTVNQALWVTHFASCGTEFEPPQPLFVDRPLN